MAKLPTGPFFLWLLELLEMQKMVEFIDKVNMSIVNELCHCPIDVIVQVKNIARGV